MSTKPHSAPTIASLSVVVERKTSRSTTTRTQKTKPIATESSNTRLTCGSSGHNRAWSVMKSPTTKTPSHTVTRFALST